MSKQFEKNQRIYWRQIFPRILSSNIAYCFAVNLSAATQLSSSTYHCSKVITSLNELLNKKRKVYWRWQRKWKIHWWLLYLVWIHLKQILAPFVGGAFFVFGFFFLIIIYLFCFLSPLKAYCKVISAVWQFWITHLDWFGSVGFPKTIHFTLPQL